MESPKKKDNLKGRQLIENEDYYFNKDGNWVFTETYHLKRGYCCKNRCLHCPYRN